MQAKIVKGDKRSVHQYREGLPRVGDTVSHQHGDEKIVGVVERVLWVSTSERVGNRVVFGTEVELSIR